MDYREFPASVALAPYVDRIWTLTGNAAELGGAVQPVLPDGRPELVLHFGNLFERLDHGAASSLQSRVLLAGQLIEQLTLKPTGAVAVLGVRFHAFGASAFVEVPQQDLAGLTIAVDDLSRPLGRALAAVYEQTDDVHCAVSLVMEALERCVRQNGPDLRVRVVTRRIVESGGAGSIDRLADQASISRRQLERLFLEAVGISPKRLARITRFQRALRVLEQSDPRRRGTATAATCGYADQSHFIREFRELAGCSPAEHLLRQGELTGFFITGTRRSSQTA
jgi:AraC-like DNA-binding protein